MVTPTLQGGKYSACLRIEGTRSSFFFFAAFALPHPMENREGGETEKRKKNNKTQDGLLFCSFTSVTQGSGMLVLHPLALSRWK